MSETCANCGEEVDKEPIVLCDECGGEPCGMTASDAVTVLAQRDALLAACEALVAGVEDAVLRFLDSHELTLRSDMDAVLRSRVERACAAIAAAKGTR